METCKNYIDNIRKYELDPVEKLRFLVENDVEIQGEISSEENELKKFLYSRRLNVSKTYNLIKNYVKFKRENPILFDNLSIEDEHVKTALENSLPELLPQKDRKCRTILVFHTNNWDGTYSLTTIYKALLLCLNYALQDIHVQNNGFVIIVNWEQFKFKKSTWLNPRIINSMIYALQECYPAKILELHFVASSWYINAAFSVFKLSLCEEIKENFHVHGRNLSTLHNFIHKEILPTELGGSRPSYNPAELIEALKVFCQINC